MSNFTDQYKDSRWQKKRLEIMERDNFTCRSCGKSEGITLNVHHAYYEKGNKVWEYPNYSLVTWCEDCHKERHDHDKHIRSGIANLSKNALVGLRVLVDVMECERTLTAIASAQMLEDSALSMIITAMDRQYRIGAGDMVEESE